MIWYVDFVTRTEGSDGTKDRFDPLERFQSQNGPVCVLGKGKALGHPSLTVLALVLVVVYDSCQLYTQITQAELSEFRSVLNYTDLYQLLDSQF